MVMVRFLETDKGSPDGIQCITYKKGQIAEISESLAVQFMHRGTIELIDEPELKTMQTQNLPNKIINRKGKK